MKKKLWFVLLIIFPFTLQAYISRICKVSYETRDGWSSEYLMEVNFLTGRELNKATKSFDYSSFSNYVLLWFDEGEVAILELDDFLIGVGEEFDNEDFQRLFQFQTTADFKQVNSLYERKWRIRAKDFITFIDPRGEN
jgi:hypothetical protein